MIDGLSARLLKAFSPFGAELDSLADTISFVFHLLLFFYLWIREPILEVKQAHLLEWFGYLCCFTACNAFRLARFNVLHLSEESSMSRKSYFTGVPAPAGTGLLLMP